MPDEDTNLNDSSASPPTTGPPAGSPKRRVAVRNVAVALTVVTSAMVVIGAAAVRYLVGDTSAPTLEIRPGAEPPALPDGPAALPTPIQPRVLKPHVDARRDADLSPLGASPTGLPPATPRGIALGREEENQAPRTAVRPGGRYR
ncbi:MAG: hypothetical protein AAGJ46_20990 [Planctomycetota bacterium]